MATWHEMSQQNLDAAKLLKDRHMFRSSVSRAYYAVYCVLSGALAPQYASDFAHAGNNPSHGQLQQLVRNNLAPRRFGDRFRQSVHRRLCQLWALRAIADYAPERTIDEAATLEALVVAQGVLKDLEML